VQEKKYLGMTWLRWLILPALLALIASVAVACGDDDDDEDGGDETPAAGRTPSGGEGGALKLGLLFPFTGDLSDFGPAFLNAATLAIEEINAAGGVNGQPIQFVQADDGTNPQQAVEEARRLIDVEGVHVIIGPAASGVTLQVVESVTAPERILVVTSSATSPALTDANDNDYLFRVPISDAAQGVIHAELAREQNLDNICTMYINNAYGQGLSEEFTKAFEAAGGTVTAQVSHEEQQTTYASELAQCGDATTLIAMSYPETAGVYLREAVEQDLFEHYQFVDGTKSDEMFAQLGWENFEGQYGTAPGALDRATGDAFNQKYQERFNEDPARLPFLRETYDAIYAVALAAQKAGSTDSTAIRDALREIANPPGETINPGEEGWAAALEALEAGEDIDYDGASSAVNWDENGDILVGAIEIWKIENGAIVVEDTRPIDLSEGGDGGGGDETPEDGE